MNIFYRICFISLVFVVATSVVAQQPTTPLERKIIEKALDNFEMYKSCITVADEETKSYFLDLFKDKSIPVYNDLLGVTNKREISVLEYLNEQKNQLVAPIIKLCNINREKIWEDKGKWKIQLSFDKSLSYQNPCGIHFDTQEFYGKMFRETMVLLYDQDNDKCLIESITGKIDSKRTLPEDYCFLESKDKRDSRILYKHPDGHSENLKFNSFGQMLLTAGHNPNQFVYDDYDVVVTTNYQPDCHLMSLSYKSYHWKIKPHFDLGLGQALAFGDKSFYSSESAKSSSFGIDAGYIFPSKSNVKLTAFMGLGFSSTSLNLSYQNSYYSFKTNQDIDGDTYTRIYEDLNVNQTTKITEFSAPVYLDLEWRANPWVSLYLDLGLRFNLNMSTSVSEFSGSAQNVHGIYSDYDDLLLDYQWGYNGFTQQLDLTKNNLCDGEYLHVNKFTPDLLVGAGLRFQIPRTSFAIDLGVGYQKGLSDIITSGLSRYDKVIYNEIDGNNRSAELVHDLVENAESITRNLLKLNIGLILKF